MGARIIDLVGDEDEDDRDDVLDDDDEGEDDIDDPEAE